MTSTTPRSAVSCRTNGILRRVADVELPAAGTWRDRGSHAGIDLSTSRRLRRSQQSRGRAVEATIVVGEDPDDRQVVVFDEDLVTATGGSGEAASGGCLVADSESGPMPWTVSGDVRIDGAPGVRATLADHGVWKRRNSAHGWFTLADTMDPYPVGGPRAPRFSYDLLADGPHAENGAA